MKNIIINDNTNGKNTNDGKSVHNTDVKETIEYFQQLVQKTILSVQKYKQLDILGANELNIATFKLETMYVELSKLSTDLTNDYEVINILKKLNEIRKELNIIFKLYGTENIIDLLNICYGDDYINNTIWNTNKYQLIENYFHPIKFKIMPWKLGKSEFKPNNVSIDKNKIVDDVIIVENSENLECFDLSRTSTTFQSKVYGVKIAFHNPKERCTIIVSGLIDDMLTTCVNNDFINTKIENIFANSIEDKDENKDENKDTNTINRFIDSLTLKELLIYSNDELVNKYKHHMAQLLLVKHKSISSIVNDFIGCELYGQRNTLVQLLLKADEHEYQYIAYLLYDLLSNDNNGIIDTTEQTLLFDSLPWKFKNYFKDAMKETINYTNSLSNFDDSKIPLEQQICLMKSDDSIKEKAMNKLKEIKSKTDDNGSKARTYLEGLLKIPFGIYKTEPILNVMSTIKERFKLTIDKVKKLDANFHIDFDINNITNLQIKNTCDIIKDTYVKNKNSKHIEDIIDIYTPDNRNDLIVNICNINNIIRKNNMKLHKLSHSGKKIEYMKTQINNFINDMKDNESIIEQLYISKNISNVYVTQSIEDDIDFIEYKWKNINTYMNSVKGTLDDAVHGHEKAKSQIMRIFAQWINGEQSGYCFGFEGAPGVGKTTFAKKGLAKCLVDENGTSRPFSFIAIGGQDNGSTLNGHNYTYVGSEWGKFVDILIKNKCMNPIIFIDELDKVSKTDHGKEIIGILTHLIDPTQNDVFQDKYFNGVELDLSKALFVFSYNDVSAIDKILLDRIHRIKFEHQSVEDKLVVTRKHILPEIYTNMGLHNCIEITDDNIIYIIEKYTNEPGIRKFKELLFEIIGEINLSCLQHCETTVLPIVVSNYDIKYKYLKDYHEYNPTKIPCEPASGIINGLWANAMGQGGIIPIEAQYFPSTSFMELKLTGLQGDVMKESMTVAKTLASSLVDAHTMSKNIERFEKTKIQGIHIHCPEGAVPKDGPSAGTAITCCIYSLLTGKKIKNNIAITGEINLQGYVTAIGGLNLKILGGLKGGVTEFIFPKENKKDYDEFIDLYKDKNLLTNIQFHMVAHIQDVLKLIF